MFDKVYNWLKIKTLPPSVEAKNRIVLERNAKDKRVFSDVGKTIRSSK